MDYYFTKLSQNFLNNNFWAKSYPTGINSRVYQNNRTPSSYESYQCSGSPWSLSGLTTDPWSYNPPIPVFPHPPANPFAPICTMSSDPPTEDFNQLQVNPQKAYQRYLPKYLLILEFRSVGSTSISAATIFERTNNLIVRVPVIARLQCYDSLSRTYLCDLSTSRLINS